MKFVTILYFQPSGNTITSDMITNLIKQTELFNNISLVSKPRVIKISSKSDIAIV